MSDLPHHGVQLLEIGPRNEKQRLDNYLLSQLKGVPKSRVYKLLRSGQVRVNKGRKKADYRLKAGDIVRIPPVRMEVADDSKAPQHLVNRVSQSVIFEDDQLLVLNKPAGIAVHSGSNLKFGVIEMLRQARPDDPMLELVHRLDRETSGCLIIAKTLKTLNQLHQHFRDKAEHMEKIYRAIVIGRWQGAEKIIDLPLLKSGSRSGERFVEVNPQGKEARSLFTPLEYKDQLSLMEVKIFTGRTHQIRVHAQAVGFPIVGDSKYGNLDFNASLKKHGFKRMYLHAYKLGFSLGSQNYNICAPLDSEWEKLLNEHE
ncbi:MAG: 23S rRNA pseudouridine(955/2504/2580) synthase [endosymbiont of Galathealinum brachiosum]|uniref:Pseudouridine synthase n=1 Tax=endosymbiont of Galathealinum brachiosum TaxID=2200906 RepID=A0A370DK10_9GAMM|nr:MAG: 23S rRNA pseudouridine(955/2504/2580) synthase [endosymbiont of Galathealinum brachiosum]